jgi:hypothetical protein
LKDGNYFPLKTTEIVHPNGSKTEGHLVLPGPRDGHCMVEYAGIVIIIGGGYAIHYCWFLFNAMAEAIYFSEPFRILEFRSNTVCKILTGQEKLKKTKIKGKLMSGVFQLFQVKFCIHTALEL